MPIDRLLLQSNRVRTIALLLFAVSCSRVTADGLALQLSHGEVRVVCPLTVGGSFEAKTAAITGTLTPPSSAAAAYGGEIVVDLQTLDTGIGLRNTHMRTKYLETDKGERFDRAVLSNLRIAGLNPETVDGRANFTATLLLHGAQTPIAGEVQLRRSGSSRHADATFPVKISDYEIAKPQYLGVGVKDEVLVRVSFDLLPVPAPPFHD
jgi:hypothetical protein